jgi:hypothetical protein
MAWCDTDAGIVFIATANSRETSREVMAAIAFLARDIAEAEAVWAGDMGGICHPSDLWEAATKNGLIDPETLYWGGRRFDQAIDALIAP